jgi:phosphoribosyl 1,2-cyclic phosphodiesterase
MEFVVLGSGSKGNGLLVRNGQGCVLIDCGFSMRELRRRMLTLDVEMRALTALVITHAHSDHVRAASTLAGTMRLRTYATEQTRDHMAQRKGITNWVPVEPGKPFKVDGMTFMPFATPHDIAGSVGYTIADGNAKLGLCTDLGSPDPQVGQALRGCHTLLVEFNYDEQMLQTGPYPPRLKTRVRSSKGHLSNSDGARLLKMALSPQTRNVVLSHLSETNNTLALALQKAKEAVADHPAGITIAAQHEPGEWSLVNPASEAAAADKDLMDEGQSTASNRVPKPNPIKSQVGVTAEAAKSTSTNLSKKTSVAVQKQLALFGD